MSEENHDAREDALFAPLPDTSLLSRLGRQLTFTFAEARRDPRGLAAALLAPDVSYGRPRGAVWSIRLGVPAASALGFALGVLLGSIFVGEIAAPALASERDADRPLVTVVPAPSPDTSPSREHGGGGGGDHEALPVSRGVKPPSSLAEPRRTCNSSPMWPFARRRTLEPASCGRPCGRSCRST